MLTRRSETTRQPSLPLVHPVLGVPQESLKVPVGDLGFSVGSVAVGISLRLVEVDPVHHFAAASGEAPDWLG